MNAAFKKIVNAGKRIKIITHFFHEHSLLLLKSNQTNG
ncbi:hypothetical protein yaldo0001_40530, partial [Yersinia aldovae ATCC 35236]